MEVRQGHIAKGCAFSEGKNPWTWNSFLPGPGCLSPPSTQPMLPTQPSPLSFLAPADHVCATFSQHLLWPRSPRTLKGIWSTLLDICRMRTRRLLLFLWELCWSTRVETSFLPHPARPPCTHPPMLGPKCPVFGPHDSGIFMSFQIALSAHTHNAPYSSPACRAGGRQKMFDKCPHFQTFRQQSLQHLLQNKHGG